MKNRILFLGGLFLLVAPVVVYLYLPTQKIDFNTQVKPILNKKCITCHGGVKREAEFSLLFRQEALAATESGKKAIIPGDVEHSELINRIISSDPEERMPYKKDPLTAEEINILTQWIKEGAQWGDHWAYVAVKEEPVPEKSDWTKTEVDPFIFAKLKENDLSPSAPADKATLLRRVSLDITGLPANKSLTKKFLRENNPISYQEFVDSLLASTHYGERWAAVWMDLARYADTKGYERVIVALFGVTAIG